MAKDKVDEQKKASDDDRNRERPTAPNIVDDGPNMSRTIPHSGAGGDTHAETVSNPKALEEATTDPAPVKPADAQPNVTADDQRSTARTASKEDKK